MDKTNIKKHQIIISRIFCEIISSLYFEKNKNDLMFDNPILKKLCNDILEQRIIFCKNLIKIIERGVFIND
jgi:hypothetical protein